MTSIKEGLGDEVYSFKVKQCFWGSLNLCLQEETNILVFRKTGEYLEPTFTIAFSYKTKEDPEGQDVEFTGEEISQVLYTSKYQMNSRPCVVVLRLLQGGYDRMKRQFSDYFEHWKDLMTRKRLHCNVFSDNLIFVLNAVGLEQKNSDDMYISQSWENGVEQYFHEIELYWSRYLNCHREIPFEFQIPIRDLSAVLSESNFKNFFTTFGLRMTEFNHAKKTNFIGFKILALGHGYVYGAVADDTDDDILRWKREPRKRAKHMREVALKMEKEKKEKEERERLEAAKKAKLEEEDEEEDEEVQKKKKKEKDEEDSD